MEKLLRDCIQLAQKKGYAAQWFVHHGIFTSVTYKNLTSETLTQNTLEKNLHLTLEKDGRKASRKFSHEAGIDPEAIVESVIQLLGFVTADPAESLPAISDAFESDVSQFQAKDLPKWAAEQYAVARKSLESAVAGAPFETGIETLIVSGSWNHSVFMNSYGAKKSSTSTYASFQIGFNGDNAGETNSEWLYRDSNTLVAYNEAWTQECLRKLLEKIQPGKANFVTGIHPIALSPELSGECIGEIL